MQITNIRIKNFRSFGPEVVDISIKNKLSAFIGLNSSGKTTALEALRKLFGVTNAEREICREDFHVAEGENTDEIEDRFLSIEVVLKFVVDEGAIPVFFSCMVVGEEGADPYLRIRLEANWKKSHTPQGDIDVRLYFIKTPDGEDETDTSKQVFPGYQRSLIEVFYVPAIRKPSEQLKYASGSILYRVLRQINMDVPFIEAFETQVNKLNELFRELPDFDTIETTLNSFWEKFHKDTRYRESNLSFSSSDIDSMLRKLEISFSPTGTYRQYKVDDLGEGYRSLFYLTLVCSLLDFENNIEDEEEKGVQRPLLTILAIEEPENHIAPQLLGRVIKILLGIAEQDNSQVLLSSHTPVIVKRLDPSSIYHFQINATYETEVSRIKLPRKASEAYKYVKEAVQHYPELYFSRLVVIGEGDSEEVIFDRLMKVYKKDFDDHFISFVPLGHRFVSHIWRLLNALNIPYITLLDLDKEREGGGWGRIKYALKQLLQVGVDKAQLLKLGDGNVLTEEELDAMHTWSVADPALDGWINCLEEYGVYYSGSLDIDFLFLEQFPEAYKSLVKAPEGPRIPDKVKKTKEFEARVVKAVQATLKSEEAKGETYSDEQKELMIWYHYHFLGRGKPVTHIQALSSLTDEELKEEMPDVLERIFKKLDIKLNPK